MRREFLARLRAVVELRVAAQRGPVLFCRQVLGVRLWKRQRELARLIAAEDSIGLPASREVNVVTGFGVGKTFLLACMVIWWLVRYGPGTRVATTAPTARQVYELLWTEILQRWAAAPKLRRLTEPYKRSIRLAPGWGAFGFSTREPQNLQGLHAPVLRLVVDEANGYPEALWPSIEACLTGSNSQLVSIGNALEPTGRFYRACRKACVRISSREHPNVRTGRELIPGAVTREWIQTTEERWRQTPEVIAARIDAVWPEGLTTGLVPEMVVRSSVDVEPAIEEPTVLGIDVARYGDNFTVLTLVRGARVEWQRAYPRTSITEVVGLALNTPADIVVVDDDGVGGGVTDLLVERGANVVPFRGNEKANDPHFRNRIAEAYFTVADGFKERLWSLPPEVVDTIVGQLCTRRYRFDSFGRVVLESKEEYTRRTRLASPDHADSMVMALDQVLRYWSQTRQEYTHVALA